MIIVAAIESMAGDLSVETAYFALFGAIYLFCQRD